ncbi:sugar transferase [Leifsonia sp. A12D58]|uniref:sugar transferase n=1 Tax=Leifsonia sp. A12D58 TaxID=3397674 RepID=UPI0039E0781D
MLSISDLVVIAVAVFASEIFWITNRGYTISIAELPTKDLRGNPFGMLEFRTMVHGADDRLANLLDAQGSSGKPLFMVMNDPRVTPVGRFIRKYSLGDIPQLINVLRAPRPQRETEAGLYDSAAHRSLFMKPGMSGRRRVSGRSKLSWKISYDSASTASMAVTS